MRPRWREGRRDADGLEPRRAREHRRGRRERDAHQRVVGIRRRRAARFRWLRMRLPAGVSCSLSCARAFCAPGQQVRSVAGRSADAGSRCGRKIQSHQTDWVGWGRVRTNPCLTSRRFLREARAKNAYRFRRNVEHRGEHLYRFGRYANHPRCSRRNRRDAFCGKASRRLRGPGGACTGDVPSACALGRWGHPFGAHACTSPQYPRWSSRGYCFGRPIRGLVGRSSMSAAAATSFRAVRRKGSRVHRRRILQGQAGIYTQIR